MPRGRKLQLTCGVCGAFKVAGKATDRKNRLFCPECANKSQERYRRRRGMDIRNLPKNKQVCDLCGGERILRMVHGKPHSYVCLSCQKERSRKWRVQNAPKVLLKLARIRASERNLPFDLKLSDIVIPDVCPVLGIPVQVSKMEGRANSPTIDRIIPELGYVSGNVKIISHRANRIKSDASLEELEKVVAYIKDHLSISDLERMVSD